MPNWVWGCCAMQQELPSCYRELRLTLMFTYQSRPDHAYAHITGLELPCSDRNMYCDKSTWTLFPPLLCIMLGAGCNCNGAWQTLEGMLTKHRWNQVCRLKPAVCLCVGLCPLISQCVAGLGGEDELLDAL